MTDPTGFLSNIVCTATGVAEHPDPDTLTDAEREHIGVAVETTDEPAETR